LRRDSWKRTEADKPRQKQPTGGKMMNSKTMKWLGGATLSLILIGLMAPKGLTQTAAPPTLTANVVSQQCQGGDGVNVTLTAVLSPNRSGVLYAWDFNGDGVLDTVPDANPTVVNLYPDEMVETATVAVIKNGRTKGTDSITFQTLRCP
jgi:hypothetical protein